MKFGFYLAVCSSLLILAGCEQKDQDAVMAQGRAAMDKAQALAGRAWKSASDATGKLTADSGHSALESAKAQMQQLQGKLSEIKAPTNLDGLKLDSVKDQIQRLEAALNIQKIRSEIDERIENAKKTKENAEKSVDDVKAKLNEADSEYQDLQKKLADAQSAYDNASLKVKESAQKVQDASRSVGL